MATPAYLDTSALAKWYLNEPNADAFEAFVRTRPGAVVSRLTALELRCLLARRRRAGDIDARIERRALETFERDLNAGFLDLRTLEDRHAIAAMEIVGRMARHGLRSLDALHLAIAVEVEPETLATADRVMAGAAKALGLHVTRFD